MPVTLTEMAAHSENMVKRGLLHALLTHTMLINGLDDVRWVPKKLSRRERLARWWAWNRPHFHFGPCDVEEDY